MKRFARTTATRINWFLDRPIFNPAPIYPISDSTVIIRNNKQTNNERYNDTTNEIFSNCFVFETDDKEPQIHKKDE